MLSAGLTFASAVDARAEAGLVGPNAVIQLAEALRAAPDAPGLAEHVFGRAGYARLLRSPPTDMIDEAIAARLFATLWREMPPASAAAIAHEAGRRTGAYVLAHPSRRSRGCSCGPSRPASPRRCCCGPSPGTPGPSRARAAAAPPRARPASSPSRATRSPCRAAPGMSASSNACSGRWSAAAPASAMPRFRATAGPSAASRSTSRPPAGPAGFPRQPTRDPA